MCPSETCWVVQVRNRARIRANTFRIGGSQPIKVTLEIRTERNTRKIYLGSKSYRLSSGRLPQAAGGVFASCKLETRRNAVCFMLETTTSCLK